MGAWGHEGRACFQENSKGRRERVVNGQNELCVPDSTPALRRDVDAGKRLESEP